jgi:hypothetical protein
MIHEEVKFRTLAVILAPTAVTWNFASLENIGDHSPPPPPPDQVRAKQLLQNPDVGVRVPRYWPGRSFIKPDYNLSVFDIYLDFTRQMITVTDS